MNTINPPLKYAVVGLGLGIHHVEAGAADPAVGRLVVCDPDSERRASVRKEHPAIAADYSDIADMLETERPHAVSIVTPDHLHRRHAELCLQAGCHVLLTKPIATNLDDARAIVRASRRSGKSLMVAHERRFRTRIRHIKALLENGELGDIVHLRIDAIQDKRKQFERSPWYASAEAGRTALVGSGIHEVDLIRHLIARPLLSVTGAGNRLGSLEFPKDKTTAAIFRFEGGIIGQVTVTYEAHWPEAGAIDDHFRLVGTRGIIVGRKFARDGDASWSELAFEPGELAASSRACVHEFVACLTDGKAVPVPGEDAFASLAAAAAADESAAQGGAPVTPALLSPRTGGER